MSTSIIRPEKNYHTTYWIHALNISEQLEISYGYNVWLTSSIFLWRRRRSEGLVKSLTWSWLMALETTYMWVPGNSHASDVPLKLDLNLLIWCLEP